ncbi:hypothetical protein P154DRAFT_548533 [Amniculicola lignicola CBS 123094]|uniref:MFS general substrate transporter n=1 Tax=Amniculicola lignicola CBS 123094 TaxID=1392246 RepID=A0A6A5W340_9PLEO|nr:hypothetical protein P154DRAFT_548533 [Amniculicola lignicola CBS 123094]
MTSLLTAIEATVTATALRTIVHTLNSRQLYMWFVNAIFLPRWPCIFTVTVCALGSGIAGGSSCVEMLIAGHTLQGVGLGGVNMLKSGSIMGIIFAVFVVGSSIGPFIGGVLVDHSSWLAILIALAHGGTLRPWSCWRTVVPLVLGFFGMLIFHAFQATGWQKEPVIPSKLFKNRTTTLAFVPVFLHGMILYWVTYFLPVYFQGVALSSPTCSGVQLLPTVVVVLPFAVLAGGLALGVGLFILLDAMSSMAQWAVFQIICAAGIGLVTTSTLPAVQVSLAESDVALLGSIWGVCNPAAIFNNEFERHSGSIRDESVRKLFGDGRAYERASAEFINTFNEPTESQIIATYESSLRRVWQISIPFCLPGLCSRMGHESDSDEDDIGNRVWLKKKAKKGNTPMDQ